MFYIYVVVVVLYEESTIEHLVVSTNRVASVCFLIHFNFSVKEIVDWTRAWNVEASDSATAGLLLKLRETTLMGYYYFSGTYLFMFGGWQRYNYK